MIGAGKCGSAWSRDKLGELARTEAVALGGSNFREGEFERAATAAAGESQGDGGAGRV